MRTHFTAWYLPCGRCQSDVALALYGRVLHGLSRGPPCPAPSPANRCGEFPIGSGSRREVELRTEESQQAMDLDRHGCHNAPNHCLPRGDRRGESGKALWANMPLVYREQATFHTDQYEVYKGVIPAEQHRAITKKARKTNHIERFNNTLRQRVSRLVRETLSFSKKLANHIGAIKYFICYYNLTRRVALPV